MVIPSGLEITPSVVRDARERLRLSQEDVAEKVEKEVAEFAFRPISPTLVAHWEIGSDRPSVAEAEALASVLLIPFCTLLAERMPPPATVDFRRGPKSPAKPLSYETMQNLSRFDAFYRLARELSRATGRMEDANVPATLEADLRDGDVIETVAGRIRNAVGLSLPRQRAWEDEEHAFQDLRSGVEDSGVFVFLLSLNVEEVRGLSKWEQGGPPAILVNLGDSPAARLFTLMHEYAHLATAHPHRAFICDPREPVSGAETIANRIAAATLLPSGPLREITAAAPGELSYGDWPFGLRRYLKQSFQVSHAVIGIRLTQLGLAASPGSIKSFWRMGGRGRSSATTAQRYRRYLGARTIGLAQDAVRSQAMSEAQIARTLGIGIEHVEAALLP